jgi:hypothetical protein
MVTSFRGLFNPTPAKLQKTALLAIGTLIAKTVAKLRREQAGRRDYAEK